MPHTAYTDDELGLAPNWDEHLDANLRREIRDARIVKRENEDLKAKVAQFERATTLSRAGIPANERGDAFARLYDGPTDDPAVVKTAFEKLFGPVTPEGNEGAGNEPDPAAGDRRVAEAAAAGGSEGSPGVVDLADAIKGAKTNAEVLEIVRQASELTTWQPGQMIPRLPSDV